MSVNAIALSGLEAASRKLDVSAKNIANATTPGYKADEAVQTAQKDGGVKVDVRNSGQDVSLENEVVNSRIATYDFQANLNVIKAQKSLTQSTLDILA